MGTPTSPRDGSLPTQILSEISPGLHVRRFSIHSASKHPIEPAQNHTVFHPGGSRSVAFTPALYGAVPLPLRPKEDLGGDFAIITQARHPMEPNRVHYLTDWIFPPVPPTPPRGDAVTFGFTCSQYFCMVGTFTPQSDAPLGARRGRDALFSRTPLPPNRTSGSPIYGSPVSGSPLGTRRRSRALLPC